jgi:predicted dithiol-disulfide oxidoreductase (DUF899 family)
MATAAAIAYPPVVSRDEWLAARKELLLKEKAATKANDALAAERRKLPMVAIDKDYAFEGPVPSTDRHTLADLFEGRRQLIVYHFMFDPDHELPCPGCSFAADNLPHLAHLHARDTSLALISRAPAAKLDAFRRRMGWTVPWYSSFGSDFNYDFHVTLDEERGSAEWNYRAAQELKDAGKIPYTKGELPGISVFLRDGDRVFHTYSTYARGLEPLITVYHLLDLTPFGRGEGWGGMPDLGQGMDWVRFHDKYDNAPKSNGCCH